jgi:ferredoxin
MHFAHLVEGPFLWIALSTFVAAIAIRTIFFALSTLLHKRRRNVSKLATPSISGRISVLYHGFVDGRPAYTISLFLFHLCLIVVPIWLYGHIIIWEESVFGFSWQPLPDVWADRLTLLLLGLAACLLARRILFRAVRVKSYASDYLLTALVALAFLTGYFLTHGTLEFAPVLDAYMMTIHVLTGEVLLLAAAFLFCKVRLSAEGCIGCAACSLSCPVGALQANDAEGFRTFTYSHYQCVCCATCVATCPEGAAELTHELSVKNLFRLFSKVSIRSVELSLCRKCGRPYLPSPQLDKVATLLADDCAYSCPTCKANATAEKLYLHNLRRNDLTPTFRDEHCAHGATSHAGPDAIEMPT